MREEVSMMAEECILSQQRSANQARVKTTTQCQSIAVDAQVTQESMQKRSPNDKNICQSKETDRMEQHI